MPCCVFRRCGNYTPKSCGVTYHAFPSNDIRCIEWTNIVRRQRREEYWQPNSSSRICSVHFKEEDKYKSPKGLTVLKKTAVPIYEEPSRIYIRRRSASPNSLEGEDISDLDSIFDSPLTAAFKQHISKLTSEKDELRQKNRNLSCRVRRLQKKVIKLKTIIKNLKKKKVVSVVEEEEEEDEEEESVIGDKVETQM